MTLRIVPVTIPAGKSMSDGADCTGSVRIVRIVMPSAWTFATLSFQMSPDGVAYHDLYHTVPGATDPLRPYAVTLDPITPNAVVAFPPNTGSSVGWIRLRSGTIATPVQQTADRVFQVVVEDADAATGGGTGAQGPTGPAGTSGATGPTGSSGSTGSVGAMGAQGAVGAVGPTGAPGGAGVAGPTGARGATGPAGGAGGQGVTDGSDAAAGQIGEVMSSSVIAGLPLTTATTRNVSQLTLTPGDWNVGGVVIFSPTSTGPNAVIAALSQVAATLPSDTDVAQGKGIMQQIWASSMPSGKTQTTPTSLIRVSVSVPTTVYLVAQATFGGGSVNVTGYISARRVR